MVSGFDSTVQNSVNVLTENVFTHGMYGMARNISDIIKPFALIIITLCFLLEFLNLTIKMDILKWEYGARVVLKFVMAKVAIDVSFELLYAIFATGTEWIQLVGDASGSLGEAVKLSLRDLIQDMKAFEALALVCTMGISFIVVWISGIIVTVMAYARMFELLIYIAVAPLPCAFIPMEGSRISKKFFLSFAGVVLQGLFIILSIKLYQGLCSSLLVPAVQASTDMTIIAFNMLLGAIVLVVSVVKSGSLAKSILDGM